METMHVNINNLNEPIFYEESYYKKGINYIRGKVIYPDGEIISLENDIKLSGRYIDGDEIRDYYVSIDSCYYVFVTSCISGNGKGINVIEGIDVKKRLKMEPSDELTELYEKYFDEEVTHRIVSFFKK